MIIIDIIGGIFALIGVVLGWIAKLLSGIFKILIALIGWGFDKYPLITIFILGIIILIIYSYTQENSGSSSRGLSRISDKSGNKRLSKSLFTLILKGYRG